MSELFSHASLFYLTVASAELTRLLVRQGAKVFVYLTVVLVAVIYILQRCICLLWDVLDVVVVCLNRPTESDRPPISPPSPSRRDSRLSHMLESFRRPSRKRCGPAYYCKEQKACLLDGRPSPVPVGHLPNKVPANYQAAFGADAEQAWHATQYWRLQEHIWNIHSEQLSVFDAYPIHVHGHDQAGRPVLYELSRNTDPSSLLATENVTADTLLRGFVFLIEHLANNVCEPGALGFSYVVDLAGASMGHFKGTLLTVKLQAMELLAAHYPSALERIIVVNAPRWLKAAPRRLPLLERVGARLAIYTRAEALAGLGKYIDMDQIPAELGGESLIPLGQHEHAVAHRQLAMGISSPVVEVQEPRKSLSTRSTSSSTTASTTKSATTAVVKDTPSFLRQRMSVGRGRLQRILALHRKLKS